MKTEVLVDTLNRVFIVSVQNRNRVGNKNQCRLKGGIFPNMKPKVRAAEPAGGPAECRTGICYGFLNILRRVFPLQMHYILEVLCADE